MSIIGIVCEFNPFHNGHKYLIDSVKKDGDTVVCVMSGNFVQRAEPSIFPKAYRVKAALQNGADIVLELPMVYATASAEIFSKNAIRILCEFGCDTICFGTENADTETLVKAGKVLNSSEFETELKKELSSEKNYAVARQKAFEKFNIEVDISSPNNILALEYTKAVLKNYKNVKINAVTRAGAFHDSIVPKDNMASASYIRELIKNGESFENFVPENTVSIYNKAINKGEFIDSLKYEQSVLTLLRNKQKNEYSYAANINTELASRIYSSVNKSTSLENIYNESKTKNYTHSRIRRAVLSLAMGITDGVLTETAPYVRVLGFKDNKAKEFGILSKNCKLPVLTSFSDVADETSKKILEYENKTSNFYNLCLAKKDVANTEMTYKIIKMK